jgi:hypothetical protein
MTREKFQVYVMIQRSTLTNMLNLHTVTALSGGTLNKQDCLNIIQNYESYMKQWPDVVKWPAHKEPK